MRWHKWVVLTAGSTSSAFHHLAGIKFDRGYFDGHFHYILARDNKTRGDGQAIVKNGQGISRLAIVGRDILADGFARNID